MNFQPPDLPNEGHCLSCNRYVCGCEVRGDYCIECQDLENADFLALWKGRPKGKYTGDAYQVEQGKSFRIWPDSAPIDWRGLL